MCCLDKILTTCIEANNNLVPRTASSFLTLSSLKELCQAICNRKYSVAEFAFKGRSSSPVQ